ncbi:hypothetical protein XENTR_v10020222 [Xenopus tropicalis]|nr:hypothetical protein XENTR_v10020222 [Xenopus tropicalis]
MQRRVCTLVHQFVQCCIRQVYRDKDGIKAQEQGFSKCCSKHTPAWAGKINICASINELWHERVGMGTKADGE